MTKKKTGMSNQDFAEARRVLLEQFLDDLQRAIDARERETSRLLAEANGEPVTPPPLHLHGCSGDTLPLLVAGIKNALSGAPDPFELKRGAGRISPHSRAERQAVMYQVLKLMHQRQISIPKAAEAVINDSKKLALPEIEVDVETIESWMENKSERAWAETALDAYEKRKEAARTAHPEFFVRSEK